MRKVSFCTIALILITVTLCNAQGTEPEMADALRADGKIYVVVLVLAAIFAGIITYLIRLDRKISKLEKTIKS